MGSLVVEYDHVVITYLKWNSIKLWYTRNLVFSLISSWHFHNIPTNVTILDRIAVQLFIHIPRYFISSTSLIVLYLLYFYVWISSKVFSSFILSPFCEKHLSIAIKSSFICCSSVLIHLPKPYHLRTNSIFLTVLGFEDLVHRVCRELVSISILVALLFYSKSCTPRPLTP